MQKIEGIINDVPDSLRPPSLKDGETVRYQLLTGNPNPDPTQRKDNPIVFPACNTIPAKDRIKDPATGRKIDIAFIESIEGKTFTPQQIAVWGKSNGGYFSCTGGKINEEELYEYLEICNYNDSNPNRDTSKEAWFKRVNEAKDSKDRSKKRNMRLEAMKYAANMTNGDLRDFAASMNWDDKLPVDILKDKIEEYAEKHFEDFTKQIENPDREVKALVKRAIDAEKIRYDTAQHRIVLAANNQTLVKLDRVEGEDYLTQTADYIMKNLKNGDKVLNTIKKLMSTSENS